MTAALSLEGVSRRFGRIVALENASLHVRPGTVHALLGENGAGKTTMMRLAFGLVRPDAGVIRVRGTPVAPRTPVDALALGIGMVHQHFTLVPAMTVAENVALGGSGLFGPASAIARVEALSRRTGLRVPPTARVGDLPIGAQQRVEILKALARDVQLLILDEPTAVLSPGEIDDLLRWVRAFAEEDRAVVLITHKLREARAIADDVTVLRAGRTVLAARARDVPEQVLVTAMLGDAEGEVVAGPSPGAPGPVILRLVGASVSGTRAGVRGVDVDIHRGEIVGVAAVEGSGHHELLRALAGIMAPASGRALVPSDVAFIPEDRHRDAVVLDFPLTGNLALRGLGQRRGRMDWPSLREHARTLLDRFDVRAPSPDLAMRDLSGGNQQKFVFGRELDPLPSAIVAENPTRGLDVKATRAVHQRLRDARAAGAAVVVYSSDVDEVLALADRVLVVHAGKVIPTVAEREVVGRVMLGAGT